MIHCPMDFVDDVESFEMIYHVFIISGLRIRALRVISINYFLYEIQI